MRVTMSARAVLAAGLPFSPYGVVLSDPGVARDEISSLVAGAEPIILRVSAVGGSAAERRLLAGDWLCDSGGEEPVRLPTPAWSLHEAARLWSGRLTWIEAWETCSNAEWMLSEAWGVGVSATLCVASLCACLRVCWPILAAHPAARSAVAAIERWIESGAVKTYGTSASLAVLSNDIDPTPERASGAGRVAAMAVGVAVSAAAEAARPEPRADRRVMARHIAYTIIYARRAVSEDAELTGRFALNQSDLADAVRRAIPTIDVLRAAARTAASVGASHPAAPATQRGRR